MGVLRSAYDTNGADYAGRRFSATLDPVKPREIALGLLVAVVWGLNFVVIDVGLHGVPPLLFAAIRFALVGLLVFVVPRPQASFARVVLVGLFMSAGQFGFLYAALAQGMNPGLASLVLQAQVPVTILVAALALAEKPSLRQLAGVALAVVGLGIVAIGRDVSTSMTGLILVLVAASSWAVGNVVARGVPSAGLSLVAWGSVVVPIPLLLASLVLEGTASWHSAAAGWGWTQTASTAFTVLMSTMLGYGIWNSLLARHRAAEVVPFALLVPAVGVISAWGFQGLLPSWGEFIGGSVLIAGAAIAVLSSSR